ncbi:hypothetical protein CXG81DRAFT_28768 [Caulochytrium protostelioides]|uniref:Uncharacterized protein n=1 Tax=Caulochytrium protostelioides TaxID=1555241 RepID=A0A4P9WY31_9FUNG|nr:hypothetical protein CAUPRSCDRAFT_10977 [Caulochytrium protostelioides]RKO98399.1 hypothetical protein CXG81DRAFT_28768 [Caulochytrium protostelioides]|eukprot:RKO98399.1 hypothetical protein CXG81DRAFT_28768 [Caulochytrium protostelioides]
MANAATGSVRNPPGVAPDGAMAPVGGAVITTSDPLVSQYLASFPLTTRAQALKHTLQLGALIALADGRDTDIATLAQLVAELWPAAGASAQTPPDAANARGRSRSPQRRNPVALPPAGVPPAPLDVTTPIAAAAAASQGALWNGARSGASTVAYADTAPDMGGATDAWARALPAAATGDTQRPLSPSRQRRLQQNLAGQVPGWWGHHEAIPWPSGRSTRGTEAAAAARLWTIPQRVVDESTQTATWPDAHAPSHRAATTAGRRGRYATERGRPMSRADLFGPSSDNANDDDAGDRVAGLDGVAEDADEIDYEALERRGRQGLRDLGDRVAGIVGAAHAPWETPRAESRPLRGSSPRSALPRLFTEGRGPHGAPAADAAPSARNRSDGGSPTRRLGGLGPRARSTAFFIPLHDDDGAGTADGGADTGKSDRVPGDNAADRRAGSPSSRSSAHASSSSLAASTVQGAQSARRLRGSHVGRGRPLRAATVSQSAPSLRAAGLPPREAGRGPAGGPSGPVPPRRRAAVGSRSMSRAASSTTLRSNTTVRPLGPVPRRLQPSNPLSASTSTSASCTAFQSASPSPSAHASRTALPVKPPPRAPAKPTTPYPDLVARFLNGPVVPRLDLDVLEIDPHEVSPSLFASVAASRDVL